MTDLQAPEDFAGWNEQMIQRHDPEIFYKHPYSAVRWVETQRVKAVIHELDLRPEHSVLDAGCGAGSLLAQLTCRELYGIDLSPTMTARAAARLGDLAKIVQGDVEKMPFADAMFDRVLASSLLAHTLHPEKVISELRRVTKPGGKIVISIADEDRIERGMHWGKTLGLSGLFGGDKSDEAKSAYHVEYHLHRFTLKRLRTLAGNTLEELDVTSMPYVFPVHWVVVYGR